MKNTAQENASLDRLAAIAAGENAGRHDDIYQAVATLFVDQNAAFSQRERGLAADILRRLAKDVEMSIRLALAERLADNPEAPHELILLLADDRIEIARPVLARSPVLTEADLVHVVEVGTTDHHLVVAGRPEIGESVTSALARLDCEAVLVTLLRNKTACIGGETFATLVERAHVSADLQEPLVHRTDLPPVLASRLYAWVSGALKVTIMQRFPHTAESLARAIDEASSAAQAGAPAASAAGAEKLVAKLATAGQLRTSFLIRVLHQGQMELFEQGFAALLQLDVETIRKALYGESPATVALACRAAGIDRSVFMTVFNISRHHRQMKRVITGADQSEIDTFFLLAKQEARARLKSLPVAA